jgi:2-polyprenyl-3-methyl-5-hydroxy-6-metoxy-1,4-benzoquinol methylase
MSLCSVPFNLQHNGSYLEKPEAPPPWRSEMPRQSVVDAWWRRHFEDRAQWTSAEAQVSAWSTEGLTARLSTFDRLLAELIGRPGIAVLDLGCGAGTYVGLLAGQGHGVTAMDYAFPMVRRARAAHGHARFVVADGHRVPFRAASFDLVLCIGVLQCCERPRALIAEAAGLVRPGGALLVESLNPLHFVVPAIKLLELVRCRAASPVVRHPAWAVERWLESSGIDVRGRVPIYVAPPRGMWPAGLVVRACRRLPVLWRLGATALWWHGRKRSDR